MPLPIPQKYDNHTSVEYAIRPSWLPRAAAFLVQQALSTMPVVVITGARQTGKTTLVRSDPTLAQLPYLTLDDLSTRLQAQADPEVLVERAPRLILDEVQRAPNLLLAIKKVVDRNPRERGRFVLTGSANLLMLRQMADTLAGRAFYVTLWPLTQAELAGRGRTGLWGELLAAPLQRWGEILAPSPGRPKQLRQALQGGGFPVPAYHLKEEAQRALWFAGYVQTYLERDLPDLRAVENLADFRRLMQACSWRLGGILNQSELGRDCGLSQPQVHRFLNVLEASYLCVRLPAYAVNRTKRLIKAPRLYWGDVGLALALSGEAEPRGAHLENLILLDLLAWRDSQIKPPGIFYWRTADGLEVDFVVEQEQQLLPIEVKTSEKLVPRDARALEAFCQEYPDRAPRGLLLYAGSETFLLTRHVLATPWWQVLAA